MQRALVPCVQASYIKTLQLLSGSTSTHLIRLLVQAYRQMLWGPIGDSVVTAWPQDCFTPLSLLHKHSEWPSTLCTDVEVKPALRKEGRKKGRALDWEESCVVARRGQWGTLSNSYLKNLTLYQNKYSTDTRDDNERNVGINVVVSTYSIWQYGDEGGSGGLWRRASLCTDSRLKFTLM